MRQQMHDDSDPVMAALARLSADGYATDEQRRAANHAYAEITTLRARLETVEAETRERCAKVAEGVPRSALAIDCGYEPIWFRHAKNIAAAIRNLEPRHD